jgi:ribosome-associated toxin RatA of RatAB toxin-antitoxin module
MISITVVRRTSVDTAGGRFSARRLAVVWSLMVLTGLPWSAAAAGADEDPQEVTVREEQGVFTIAARFTVPASPAIAMAVLTDYDNIPRFLPNVRTSRELERTGSRALVEQAAVVRFMFFSTRIHLLLGIDEAAASLRFVDRCGKSFSRYEGAWTLTSSDENGVVISYELTAKPTFDAPAFLIRRLMQRDASEQIRRLREEMVARSRGQAVSPQRIET